MFVGPSNRTQIAVLKYYLTTVKLYGVPKTVRADKGTETILAAATQFALRRARKPQIELRKAWAMVPLQRINESSGGGGL